MGDRNSAGRIYQTSVWLVQVGVQVCWLWRIAMLSAETGSLLIWQSVFPFRQKVLKLETLVQSSSHDFGKHLETDFLGRVVTVWQYFCSWNMNNYIFALLGQASSLHYEAEELRQQCVLFLSYIKVFIYRYRLLWLGSSEIISETGLTLCFALQVFGALTITRWRSCSSL